VRVAAFLAAWEEGLAGAGTEFMRLIRRLGLSDYNKIREVLLDAEGQPLASYMLDVFDRVLQHEIEGHRPTIAAAQELNAVDPAKYPTPYIAGSSDLQNLAARLLWQNAERLKITATTAGMSVSFGDALVRRSRLDAPLVKAPADRPDVLVVLTPACDLVRNPRNTSGATPRRRAEAARQQDLDVQDQRAWNVDGPIPNQDVDPVGSRRSPHAELE
jgi:hypothetical protein